MEDDETMKTMKKLLALLLLASLPLTAAACDKQEDAPTPEPPQVEPEPEPDPIYNPLTGLEVEAEIEGHIIAVSTDNHPAARPQSGISQADIVYEIPAEGNIPRLVALYYSQRPENVGPIRSARPYAIDIARGWDALFVHCGGSPAAYTYLSGTAVVSIDEIAYGSYFWRDYTLHRNEHTLYTSIDNMYEYLEYREKPLVQENVTWMAFRHDDADAADEAPADAVDTAAADEADAAGAEPAVTKPGSTEPAGEKADWLRFHYTETNNIYVYHSDTGLYARYIGEYAYKDANNDEQIMAANVIMQRVSSRVLDGSGRLEIDMCAGGEAILFSGGQVVKGTWSRASLDENTKYYDETGAEFVLAPGQTWIQLCDSNVTVEYRDTTAPEQTDDTPAQ